MPRTQSLLCRRRARSRCFTHRGTRYPVDSHIYYGYTVPPFYDSMIGKLIAHGEDRMTAIARARTALSETVIDGIKTNIPLHEKLCRDPDFLRAARVFIFWNANLPEAVG